MDVEAQLGWLIALAWLCGLSWLLLMALRSPRKSGDASPLVVAPLAAGAIVFLYWIVAGKSAVGIDHIRPQGVPIGLWGLGFAGAMALVFAKRA